MNNVNYDEEIEKMYHPENFGLIDVGIDEDGQVEWLGTPDQWDNFEKLN